ncbi:MAG: hypothetical protein ACRELA_08925 [Candidatus Rokuibacteriota bacterium]
MSGESELDIRVRDHARKVAAGDMRASEDLAPGAQVEPADLLDRLLRAGFRAFEVVAHARVGAHHLLKTKYLGPPTMVIQTRWVQGTSGHWEIHEAELLRVVEERGG